MFDILTAKVNIRSRVFTIKKLVRFLKRFKHDISGTERVHVDRVRRYTDAFTLTVN